MKKPYLSPFWVLATPAAGYNLACHSCDWADIGYIIFDELHVADGMMLLLLVFVVRVIRSAHARRSPLKLIFMSATMRGALVEAVSEFCRGQGIELLARDAVMVLHADEAMQEFHRVRLDEVDNPRYQLPEKTVPRVGRRFCDLVWRS